MPGIDLHVHSTASDGFFPPREVVRRAYSADLTAVALTDHDTLAGLPEARREAKRVGLAFIPGCEISIAAPERCEVHLLAYFIDPGHPGLFACLREICASRERRVVEMVAQLNRLGVALTVADVRAEAQSSAAVGRGHLAAALVRRGLVADRREAFQRYLQDGGDAFVGKDTPAPPVVLALVWDAGGVPVVAHPGLLGRDDLEDYFRDWDLGGIEADHPGHDPGMVARLHHWARERDLPATGGSDWHGEEAPRAYLGCRSVPPEVVDRLWRLRRAGGSKTPSPVRPDV